MMLGDVLNRIHNDGEAIEIILGAGDLRLLTAMQRQAQADGLDLAAYTGGRPALYGECVR